MLDEKIAVKSYSGYRADEAPRSFILRGEEIEIAKILDLWIEEGAGDRARKRFFRVMDRDGFAYKIYRNERTEEWFLCKTRR